MGWRGLRVGVWGVWRCGGWLRLTRYGSPYRYLSLCGCPPDTIMELLFTTHNRTSEGHPRVKHSPPPPITANN